MKLVCIDLDNTLAYTGKMHLLAFKKAFRNFGLKPVSDKRILHLFGMISEDMIKKLYPKVNQDSAKKITRLHNDIAIKETYKYAKAFSGSAGSLRYLKSKGYKIAIISNSSFKEVKKTLSYTKLDKRLYDKIISKDNVKKSKPSPEGINLAKKIFRTKDAFMIGDTPYDIIAGNSAKVKTIAVATGSHSARELSKYNPDFILGSIADVKKIIH